jgi:hypothetical protein
VFTDGTCDCVKVIFKLLHYSTATECLTMVTVGQHNVWYADVLYLYQHIVYTKCCCLVCS